MWQAVSAGHKLTTSRQAHITSIVSEVGFGLQYTQHSGLVALRSLALSLSSLSLSAAAAAAATEAAQHAVEYQQRKKNIRLFPCLEKVLKHTQNFSGP